MGTIVKHIWSALNKIAVFMFLASGETGLWGQAPDTDGSWRIEFVDNFNTIKISRWNVLDNDVPGEAGLDEEEYIHRRSNVYLTQSFPPSNRWLSLTLEKLTTPLPHPGEGIQTCRYVNGHEYTAGRVMSWDKYQYGYFEIETLLPVGSCHFPAFWLHSSRDTEDPYYNEIDIMEVFGGMENRITTNVHYRFNSKHIADTSPVSNTHIYHVYAAEWTKSRIIWFVDGEIVRVDANDYDGIGIQNPMHIIFNIARYEECLDEETEYPGEMRVKRIGAYSLKCDSLAVVSSIPDFGTYNYALKRSISLGGETAIPANASIALRATDYIEWRPGFEIPHGTEM